MKLIGLMCLRNEAWVAACSMRVALNWVDELVVVDHNSTDGTIGIINDIAQENPWRVHYSHWQSMEKKTLTSRYANDKGEFESWETNVPIEDESRWDEQEMRQHSLLLGRKHGGTHFAMIDADEILTANLLDRVRLEATMLGPGEVLEYPLYAMRSLDEYQDDGTKWCGNQLSLVFKDAPRLAWRVADDGYDYHSRKPRGTGKCIQPLIWSKTSGGVMHLQFANERRLLAKHVAYRMLETIRWPGRMKVEDLNAKYDDALHPAKHLSSVPPEWWGNYDRHLILLGGWPWHEGEIRELIAKHGRDKFSGLDLKGLA